MNKLTAPELNDKICRPPPGTPLARSVGVVVYLAQNTTHDPTYGRDSLTLLTKSLDLFYKNYNDRFQADVIVFHNGDFTEEGTRFLRVNRPTLRFEVIPEGCWHVPIFLEEDDRSSWISWHSMGHRMMCRWYSWLLYDYLDPLGY